jgi:DNA modification methylase
MIELNKIYPGDVIEVLKTFPPNFIQCAITSPPYWAIRNYEVDGQIGIEESPKKYVEKIVSVFREVKRVLREDGTLWLNLGDVYCGSADKGDWKDPKYKDGRNGQAESLNRKIEGLKPKDLVGIPWRVAFALQEDGWYLRSDIIWNKVNVLPSPVTDRPTSSHEYIFLLTKNKYYFYDAEAIREQTEANESGRNKRSIWHVSSEPRSDGHYASFPQKLIEPCILAGTSEKGACATCGVPWKRKIEVSGGTTGKSWHDHKDNFKVGNRAFGTSKGFAGSYSRKTTGWEPDCECNGRFEKIEADGETSMLYIPSKPIEEHPISPCTVLDPFMGSGTTALVSIKSRRNFIGVELNEKYIAAANDRISQELAQERLF